MTRDEGTSHNAKSQNSTRVERGQVRKLSPPSSMEREKRSEELTNGEMMR
jgi:hypothetical protein